jgi:hypothetical protein
MSSEQQHLTGCEKTSVLDFFNLSSGTGALPSVFIPA